MRRLTTTIALVLFPLAAPLVFTDAARGTQQCPTVRVSCMDTAGCAKSVTFSAEVSGSAADAKLSYNWTVSAGTIKSGQGTSSITVDTTGLAGISVKAAVQVTGLPETCAGRATCATALICEPGPERFDEYGNVSFNVAKARLDNFAAELQNVTTTQGYLVCYGGRRSRLGEAQGRCNRAKNYLVKMRGIDVRRIVTVDGGYRETAAVEMWVIPSGFFPPAASPTVDPREVRFITGKLKGRARHR